MDAKAATRISKLMLLLSSDQQGEVVAAAAAIGRALEAAGMTWHDLGALVAGGGRPDPAQWTQPPSYSRPHDGRPGWQQQQPRRPRPTQQGPRPNSASWEHITEASQEEAAEAHAWMRQTGVGVAFDKEFVASLAAYINAGNAEWTPKQRVLMVKIARRNGWGYTRTKPNQ